MNNEKQKQNRNAKAEKIKICSQRIILEVRISIKIKIFSEK